jgi:hypothetical protein
MFSSGFSTDSLFNKNVLMQACHPYNYLTNRHISAKHSINNITPQSILPQYLALSYREQQQPRTARICVAEYILVQLSAYCTIWIW